MPPESLPRAPRALRRSYPLPVEMAILAATIGVWQLLRIPFEGSTRVSLAHARDWLDLERAMHIDIEPSVLRFVHSRDWLLSAAQSFYRNVNEPAVFGFMAVARLLDPVRYPKLRTAYVLLHVPALAILALYPLAPPHWVAGMPFADGPPAHPSELRNETAAAVSLHFGAPVMIAAGALWLRPRAVLAWLTLLYPPLVFVVILGTGNHYVLDAVVGSACVAAGFAAAHALHGRLPRGRQSAGWARVALAGTGFALIAFVINGGFIGELNDFERHAGPRSQRDREPCDARAVRATPARGVVALTGLGIATVLIRARDQRTQQRSADNAARQADVVDASLLIAHRAGNDPAHLRAAERAGVDIVEADLHLRRGRLELRHLKTVGPLPVYWDRWALAPPLAALRQRRRAARRRATGDGAHARSQGQRSRRPPGCCRRPSAAPRAAYPSSVCARAWPLLDEIDPALAQRIGSAARPRQLDQLIAHAAERSLDGASLHLRLLDGERLGALRAHVPVIMTWPVNHWHEVERATALGVSGLISDDLALLGELRERLAYAGRRLARRASRKARVRNVISNAITPTVRSSERDAELHADAEGDDARRRGGLA